MQPKSILVTAILASLILFLTTSSMNCPPPGYQCPADPVAEIDPAHAQFSPVAQRIFLQLLKSDSCKEKGNVKLFAQYAADDYSKDSLAFMHEGKKLVLQDNGIFPDAVKDDQEYTVIAQFDTAALRLIYTEALTAVAKASSIVGKEKASFISFNGREVVENISRAEAVENSRFNFDDFVAGKKTEMTIEFPSMADVRSNSLYIIDTRVVEDPTRTLIPGNAASNPNGAWTFKKIMEGMANTTATGISAEDFTLQWLQKWKAGGIINGDNVGPRNLDILIARWKKTPTGKLDLNQSPFKLVAIVNRLDLMPTPVYSTTKNGGELRFVFVITNPDNPTVPLNPPGGDIIFEFGVNKMGNDLIDYAKKWYALKDIPVGSADYNNKLEAITSEIIKTNAESTKPNGSNLNQLRTNDIIFGGWQLREFVIDGTTHLLKDTTVKQEPSQTFNDGSSSVNLAKLKQFIDDREKEITRNRYTIPEKLSDGTPFLGGKSDYPNNGTWGNNPAGKINSDQARFVLSLNTCSGCHLNEAGTGFLHNSIVSFGQPTSLSRFIKGNSGGLGTNEDHFTQNDVRGVPHSFNDLARRAKVLWGFMNSHPTLFGLQYNPVNMEH